MSGADGFGRRAVLAGGLAAGLAAVTAQATPARSLKAADGRYRAERSVMLGERSVSAFPGIRYARAERFRAPRPVLLAEQPGRGFAVSPQQSDRYGPQGEDCLFLNVWKPDAPAAPRPVLVYFHGGAYSTGSVTDPLNDGTALAARGDVVVVTVNHRLNAFGYLYLARLDPRFPDSGNAGQLDLICALEWIRRNIAAFGGDPENVTVFGQSGGGAKIATLMAMPAARGLFHKAITMSGQQVTASGPLNATRRAEAVLARLDGADPATVPVAQLVAALAATDPVLGGGVYMGPVLDMRNLHRHPFWPDAAPQGHAIPLLLGNTVLETRAFYPAGGKVLGGLTMDNLAARIAPEMRIDAHPEWVVSQFRRRYPQDSAERLFHRIVTAARSWRGQVIEAEMRAQAGVPAFVYQLDFADAGHTDDIGLAFGTVPAPSPAQAAMSATVMAAFVRFARSGDPGWPAYDLAARQTMVFDQPSRVVSDPRQWERELFARVPYIQPGT